MSSIRNYKYLSQRDLIKALKTPFLERQGSSEDSTSIKDIFTCYEAYKALKRESTDLSADYLDNDPLKQELSALNAKLDAIADTLNKLIDELLQTHPREAN